MCKNYAITPKRGRKQKQKYLCIIREKEHNTTKAIQHKHNTTKNNKSKYTTNNKQQTTQRKHILKRKKKVKRRKVYCVRTQNGDLFNGK